MPAPPDTTSRADGYLRFVALAAIVVSILLRFAQLDADPHYYDWIGYISDEGRWVGQARNLAQSHDVRVDAHLSLAPLYNAVTYAVFEVAGISRSASRILSALCGSFVVALFWLRFRRELSAQALLLASVILGFQVDLVVLSRVAIPETTVILFQLLIYLIMVGGRGLFWQGFGAGLLMCVAIGFKATVAPFAGILTVMLLLLRGREASPSGRLRATRGLLGFWSGVALPCLVGGLTLLLSTAGIKQRTWELVSWVLHNRIDFAEWTWGIFFFFTDPVAPPINYLSLGLWLSLLLRFSTAAEERSPTIDRWLLSSAIWIVLYLGLAFVLAYFPSRYKIHLVVPLVLHFSVALSRFQKLGFGRVTQGILEGEGVNRWFRLFLLAAPSGVLAAPLVAHALSFAGLEGERLISKLFSIGLAASVLAMGMGRSRARSVCAVLIAMPLVGGLVWLGMSSTDAILGSVWPLPGVPSLLGWYGLGQLLAFGSVCLLLRSRGSSAEGRLIVSMAVLFLIVSIPRLLPAYLHPHFTLPKISRELEDIIPPGEPVGVTYAEGLFLDNALRYYPVALGESDDFPAFFVTVPGVDFGDEVDEETLAAKYDLIRRFDIYVSPEFYSRHPEFRSSSSIGEEVRLYRRRGGKLRGGDAG